MPRIHDAVESYLTGREWPYEDHGDYFATPARGDHGSWVAFFAISEEDEQLIVHSVLSVEIPSERLDPVALYLTRANFGLGIGNFEMDLDSGDVRYKTSVDVAGAEINDALIDHLFLANIVTVDRYLEGLAAVVAGGDPAAAAAAADAD
jgi:hypothetical protein